MEFLLLLIILFLVYKLYKSKKAVGLIETPKIDLPYHQKTYFFSRSEQEFFNILNANIDAHRYTVFPKVRLGDFIQVDSYRNGNKTWWNKIRAKHVDFLIWDLNEKKIVLAIEVDGSSHNSERMNERDRFVNDLYEKVELKLIRVRVGTNFEKACREIDMLLQT